jgi:hypothetical protein
MTLTISHKNGSPNQTANSTESVMDLLDEAYGDDYTMNDAWDRTSPKSFRKVVTTEDGSRVIAEITKEI